MSEFFKELFFTFSQSLFADPSVPSSMLSQYIWFNWHIKIANKSGCFSDISGHGISYIGNFFDINGKSIWWDTIKYEYNFANKKINSTSSYDTKNISRSVKWGLMEFCKS